MLGSPSARRRPRTPLRDGRRSPPARRGPRLPRSRPRRARAPAGWRRRPARARATGPARGRVATPMRRPVNVPGPTPTAIRSTLLQAQAGLARAARRRAAAVGWRARDARPCAGSSRACSVAPSARRSADRGRGRGGVEAEHDHSAPAPDRRCGCSERRLHTSMRLRSPPAWASVTRRRASGSSPAPRLGPLHERDPPRAEIVLQQLRVLVVADSAGGRDPGATRSRPRRGSGGRC